MKFCLIPQDFDAPGCYRLIFPMEQMTERGHSFVFPHRTRLDGDEGKVALMLDETFANPLLDADTYVFQQQLMKVMPDVFRILQNRGKAIVTDADDYYEGAPSWNAGIRGVRANPDMSVKVLKTQRQMADTVVVSTPFLYDKYRRDNKNTHLIRNSLDWRMWSEITPAYEVERARVRVGWVGAAAWRSGDLAELERWFPDWIARHPEVDFVAAGTSSELVHDGLRIPHAQRITLPQIDFKSMNHPLLVSQYDIGLVPLKMIPFNEAKSHLKGLEYNACGIPYIAAPTESYRWWTEDGENGFLARKPKEWEDYLDMLVWDHSLRQEMGRKAREKAESQSIQHRWPEFEKAWTSKTRTPNIAQIARTSVSYGAIQKWQELEPLLQLAKDAKVIVEIGSAAGGTMWAWSRVAPDDATIISIDLPEGIHGGHQSHLAEVRKEAFCRADQNLYMIRGDSTKQETLDELLGILDGREIDLLFVDGDHTYAGVKSDWEMYSPLAKVVALHDIAHHNPDLDCHVDDLWAELTEGDFYKFAEFTAEGVDQDGFDWAGIGVIFREASLASIAA